MKSMLLKILGGAAIATLIAGGAANKAIASTQINPVINESSASGIGASDTISVIGAAIVSSNDKQITDKVIAQSIFADTSEAETRSEPARLKSS